jgi:hypothetical protein
MTDREAQQLVKDVRRMAQELRAIARDDKDSARREQARRWLDVLVRESEYAIQCRDQAARRI